MVETMMAVTITMAGLIRPNKKGREIITLLVMMVIKV